MQSLIDLILVLAVIGSWATLFLVIAIKLTKTIMNSTANWRK